MQYNAGRLCNLLKIRIPTNDVHVAQKVTLEDNSEDVESILHKLRNNLNLSTFEDWNSITKKDIKENGGSKLFNKYSTYDIKCLGYPEGKLKFNGEYKPQGYWNDTGNIKQFLHKIKEENNLKNWNSITRNLIIKNGGSRLLHKYSVFELKTLINPEEKSFFDKPAGYWENRENIIQFVNDLKEKLNLKNSKDWNLISHKQIQLLGGSSLLNKISLFELKCIGYPKGKYKFEKPIGYWENKENVIQFLDFLKDHFHLKTFEDWNSLHSKQILSFNGGSTLLNKYSLYELKCLGFPDGKLKFNSEYKPAGYWDNKENIQNFLNDLKNKYNLQSFDDWNSISRKQIHLLGGGRLFSKYSLYELKCLGFPDGKLKFNSPRKILGYWNDSNNIFYFLSQLKEKYNLQTPEDWNLITSNDIQVNGGSMLLHKYSMFELKCLACPDGILFFDKPNQFKPHGYWDNHENIHLFINQLKEKLNLKNPKDWNRLSVNQIKFLGGSPKKLSVKEIIQSQNLEIDGNITRDKRSSQRWLFLQIQKLFPGEEIVEDYFHSQISRESGSAVQFDIFLIERNIAFEYHGIQHYEDISSGFAPVEMYKNRDNEKVKLCEKFGIKLIIIPYWWDCKLDSLKVTLEQNLILVK